MNEVFFPSKEKFINPYTDTGFKRIFGSEINKDMIIKFLNSLLDETITDITFRNVEALGLGVTTVKRYSTSSARPTKRK